MAKVRNSSRYGSSAPPRTRETAGRFVEKTVVRAAFVPSHVDERDDPFRRREPHFAGVVLGARELYDPLSFLQTLRNRARTIGPAAPGPCGTTCEHEQKPDSADRLRKRLAVRTKTRMLHSGCHIYIFRLPSSGICSGFLRAAMPRRGVLSGSVNRFPGTSPAIRVSCTERRFVARIVFSISGTNRARRVSPLLPARRRDSGTEPVPRRR